MSAQTIAVSPTLSVNRSKTGHLSCSGELQKMLPTCYRRDGVPRVTVQRGVGGTGGQARRCQVLSSAACSRGLERDVHSPPAPLLLPGFADLLMHNVHRTNPQLLCSFR